MLRSEPLFEQVEEALLTSVDGMDLTADIADADLGRWLLLLLLLSAALLRFLLLVEVMVPGRPPANPAVVGPFPGGGHRHAAGARSDPNLPIVFKGGHVPRYREGAGRGGRPGPFPTADVLPVGGLSASDLLFRRGRMRVLFAAGEVGGRLGHSLHELAL